MDTAPKESPSLLTGDVSPIALVSQLFAAVNAGELTKFERLVADSYVQHATGVPQGRQGLFAYFSALRQAFPDLTLTIGPAVENAFLGACVVTTTGTHQGYAFGVSATGRRVSLSTVEMFASDGHVLTEHWASVDTADIIRQLTDER